MQIAKYQKEKIILTDVDGCLVDWNISFHSWMQSQNHERKMPTARMIEDQYELPMAEVRKLIRTFNDSNEIANLPSFLDANTYIKKLYDLDYRFICITSIGNNDTVKKNRIKNLTSLFGKDAFLDFVFLKTYEPKDEVLKDYKDRGSYWIEDSRSQYLAGLNQGLISFHLTVTPEFDDSVLSWKEIYKKIVEKK